MIDTNDPKPDDPLDSMPPLLTLEETATLFRVTTRTLRRWVRMGKLRTLRTAADGSGRVLIEKVEIRRFWDSLRQPRSGGGAS